MRNPLSKALWSIRLVVLGAGLVLLANAFHAQIGETTAAILPIIGIAMAAIFLFTFLWAHFSAIGYARLMSGKDLIVRWHVTAGDWGRFRTRRRYARIRVLSTQGHEINAARRSLNHRNDIRD